MVQWIENNTLMVQPNGRFAVYNHDDNDFTKVNFTAELLRNEDLGLPPGPQVDDLITDAKAHPARLQHWLIVVSRRRSLSYASQLRIQMTQWYEPAPAPAPTFEGRPSYPPLGNYTVILTYPDASKETFTAYVEDVSGGDVIATARRHASKANLDNIHPDDFTPLVVIVGHPKLLFNLPGM